MVQQLFNDLIKQDVKPFLGRHDFKKKGLNFHKTTEGLTYMVQFQKSGGNTADHVMFYVNCGIYATELARIGSKEILAEPNEVDCHFRERIKGIAPFAPDRFSITPDTNMDELRETLLRGVEEVIHFYEAMTSARSIVDYYTSGPFLHLSEESFHFLLQSSEVAAATHFLKALQEKYGSENRWSIFEKKYKAIFDQYGVEFAK